ncbi:hypothetical protein ACUXOC_000238 [Corynebacterium mucifaciens]
MSDERERLARQWAERIKSVPELRYDLDANAAADFIFEHTSPPTMADVEWDDDKHYLAGATGPFGDEVVMMWYDDGTDHIFTNGEEWPRDRLTPNGKRYELREVGAPEQPEHPATLATDQDYENAPEGTVVAEPSWQAWQKRVSGKWVSAGYERDSVIMAGTERQVLREGWGK